MTTKRKKKGRPAVPSAAAEAPGFDPLMVSELIEACRANVASLTELAEVTSRALHECYEYEYEDDEPHLGSAAIWCVRCSRRRKRHWGHSVSFHGRLLRSRAQRKSQTVAKSNESGFALQVIRAAIYILRGLEHNHDDQVLPALRDLEIGIASVVEGFERVIQHCSNTARTDT